LRYPRSSAWIRGRFEVDWPARSHVDQSAFLE
jgi:hypothetical protein